MNSRQCRAGAIGGGGLRSGHTVDGRDCQVWPILGDEPTITATSPPRPSHRLDRRRFQLLATSLLLTGCRQRLPADRQELVVYSALDREFAEPILQSFEAESGIRVRAVFDVESTKTVGLTQRLLAERARPRCDLFWNNEILNTLRLQEQGLLAPLAVPAAGRFPAEFRDQRGQWFGFAARARILLVNTERLAESDYPRRLADLATPAWQGRFGLAKPLFGTTATHAACLFAAWGTERAQAFWQTVLRQGQVLSGNKQVAMAVGAGQLDCGMTDTDDALAELGQGSPVKIIYPDQPAANNTAASSTEAATGPAPALGTLFIPNTLAPLAGRPRTDLVVQLVSYLLSADVERRLAEGASGQVPLGQGVAARLQVESPQSVQPMQVDFAAAARRWSEVSSWLANELKQI